MCDVLLAHSYFLELDPKQMQKMKPYPPLATLHVAAFLRQVGFNVALFDAMLADGEHEFATALQQHQPRVVALFEDNFNFLSKMCLSRMRQAALTMIGMAQRTGAWVIVAGSDVTDHAGVFLDAGAHVALLGEGDHALREVIDVLAGSGGRRPFDEAEVWSWCSEHLPKIAGLAFRDCAHGPIKKTAPRVPERQPDVFPMAAWDLVDVEKYRAAWMQAHGYFSLNLASTRGCPFHCNWCAKPIWGQRYAMRTPAHVAEELAFVKQKLRPDHVWFADDIFGLRPQWVTAFAQEVTQRAAAVPFMIQSRADLMTTEAVRALKQAGCAEVWLGAESGSQKILDAMDKGIRVEQIREARARLKQAGIRACFFIQFGYPGETWDDIVQTIELVRDCVPDNVGVSVSYPLPGTPFYNMVQAQLGEKDHWTDSDELAMMFTGTYQSPFYKVLHRLLHLELEHRQGHAVGTALNAAWLELRAAERQYRNTHPTAIAKANVLLAAPDLTQAWN
jgi:anaerobic magnesium-protoporphyrin IX monomethyl ester cyclase